MVRTILHDSLCLLVLLFWLASKSASAMPQTVHIGVLAIEGNDIALRQWTDTARYLDRQIPRHHFTIIPYSLKALDQAVANNKIDFLLTNPGNYVELESRYGVSRLATLKSLKRGKVYKKFAAVIFTRSERNDINSLADLKGKVFAGVSQYGFGGFQMAWREFHQQGIDPFQDFADIRFTGLPQDKIVYEVLQGKADAGSVRSEVIERLVADGTVSQQDIRILNPRISADYPFVVSTALYPEWPFAKLKHTTDSLAEQVAMNLLKITPDTEAARAARIAGWTIPLDYNQVHDLFKELGIGPYAVFRQASLKRVLMTYFPHILTTVFIIMALAVMTIYVARVNRKLSDSRNKLIGEIEQRKRIELAHVSRLSTIGEMASGMAHELNQPLTAIINYIKGCVHRLQDNSVDKSTLIDALQNAAMEAERAGAIIHHLRKMVRNDEPLRETASINEIIHAAIRLMQVQLRSNNIQLVECLQPELQYCEVDQVQLEQVLINLMVNAVEAMQDCPVKILNVQSRQGENGVEITIRDTGCGMSAEVCERVFDPFFTTRQGGMGLGLSISSTIVEAHHGNLKVESVVNTGTVFSIVLPEGSDAKSSM